MPAPANHFVACPGRLLIIVRGHLYYAFDLHHLFIVIVNEPSICIPHSQNLNEEKISVFKDNFIFKSKISNWYLDFVRLGSSNELVVQCAFCRFISIS